MKNFAARRLSSSSAVPNTESDHGIVEALMGYRAGFRPTAVIGGGLVERDHASPGTARPTGCGTQRVNPNWNGSTLTQCSSRRLAAAAAPPSALPQHTRPATRTLSVRAFGFSSRTARALRDVEASARSRRPKRSRRTARVVPAGIRASGARSPSREDQEREGKSSSAIRDRRLCLSWVISDEKRSENCSWLFEHEWLPRSAITSVPAPDSCSRSPRGYPLGLLQMAMAVMVIVEFNSLRGASMASSGRS